MRGPLQEMRGGSASATASPLPICTCLGQLLSLILCLGLLQLRPLELLYSASERRPSAARRGICRGGPHVPASPPSGGPRISSGMEPQVPIEVTCSSKHTLWAFLSVSSELPGTTSPVPTSLVQCQPWEERSPSPGTHWTPDISCKGHCGNVVGED